MFLQAAGMRHEKVRPVADRLDLDGLTNQQRALAQFAWKAAGPPVSYLYADSLAARSVLKDEGEFLEAALVTAGFSFANRCADALGVRTEVPAFLRRWPELKWSVMRLLSGAIRLRTDFDNRPAKRPCAERVLDRLHVRMKQAGMGDLRPFFERLHPRPDLMDVQARATEAALLENTLGRQTNMRLAYVISSLNADSSWVRSAERELRRMRIPLEPMNRLLAGDRDSRGLDLRDRETLLFARDIALHPDRITDGQVEQLRALGLTDVLILDLVAVCAAIAAGNRLNRVLVPDDEQRPTAGAANPACSQ